MKIIAHRCGTDKFPELTLDAARYSLVSGADYVEIDIRFTRDCVPVICHDDNASVLFGSAKEIAELSIDEFLSFRYASSPYYAGITLAQVLQSQIAPILFHVKVGGNYLRQILDCISAYGYEKNVIMGVKTADDVCVVKEYNPEIQVLAFSPKKELAMSQAEAGADIIRLWEAWTTQEEIDLYKGLGKRVWIMAGAPNDGSVGVTDFKNLQLWKRMGADGVLINEVVKARNTLTGVIIND